MEHASKHGNQKLYVIGYILSLLLTIVPLFAVIHHTFAHTALIVCIITFAIVQMFIQLFFFMHVTEKDGEGPAWHGIALILGLVVVFTIVAGSLWTMSFSSVVQ